jgi:hypothetical protein
MVFRRKSCLPWEVLLLVAPLAPAFQPLHFFHTHHSTGFMHTRSAIEKNLALAVLIRRLVPTNDSLQADPCKPLPRAAREASATGESR